MNRPARAWQVLFVTLGCTLASCEPPEPGPQGDSHTNWLRSCERDRDCGDLSCLCGVCTLACDEESACSSAPGSSCLAAEHAGTVAVCGGTPPQLSGLCLPSCTEGSCGAQQACVGGACQPLAAPTAHVAIDTSIQLQTLTGFGATVGYAEDEIAAFHDRAALDQAMFAGLGLDVLRFRNRYGEVAEPVLSRAADLVASAASSLGRTPLVLLSSWSPPPSLKQNAATFCSDPATCKLTRTVNGDFDYAGLAAHWRGSLDAYARVGFVPDYVGIQNNPNWAPAGGAVAEACKFLPSEGSLDVVVDGVSVAVAYPGYRQALAAVTSAIADLPGRPRILAPELSGIAGAESYLNELDPSQIDAVAHHMYGAAPADLDVAGLQALAQLGDDMGLPLFQTEMQADGFDTAVLIQRALADGGASMYLQTALVGPLSGPVVNPSALLGLEGDDLVLQDAYFAMSHFSRFTDPGWQRVAALSSAPGLLASAWLSPERDALTVILVNAAPDAMVVAVDVGAENVRSATLSRTVFDGSERLAALGAWSVGSSITLPARAIATLVIDDIDQ